MTPGPASIAEEIDEDARRRFESDWAAQKPQELTTYLPPSTDSKFLGTAEELVHIDIEFRWKSGAQKVPRAVPAIRVEDYLRQIPGLNRPGVILRLVQTEFRARLHAGERPTLREYCERFPGIVTSDRDLSSSRGSTAGPSPSKHIRLAAGDRLGTFQLESPLGRGGMGEVWKALDLVVDRTVVIKIVPPELSGYPEEMARVKSTFQQAHSLQHEHICPMYLLADDPRIGYYVVMKYLPGTTLSAWWLDIVRRENTFPVSELVRVLMPVAAALDYAHGQKVIHRDVKPQNIMIATNGTNPQVVDFGLAAEYRTSITRVSQVRMDVSGTYPYMAPEQWRGQYQDGRTDQYALGVVAFELLTGQWPFEAPDETILRQCVLNEPVPSIPFVSKDVNAALARALAKDRTHRFDSCRDFINAIAGFRIDEKPLKQRKYEQNTPIQPSAEKMPSPQVTKRVELPEPARAAAPLPMPQVNRASQLSRKQREVISLAAAGHDNRSIAEQLRCREGDVVQILEDTLEQLGLMFRSDLIQWAVDRSLVAPQSPTPQVKSTPPSEPVKPQHRVISDSGERAVLKSPQLASWGEATRSLIGGFVGIVLFGILLTLTAIGFRQAENRSEWDAVGIILGGLFACVVGYAAYRSLKSFLRGLLQTLGLILGFHPARTEQRRRFGPGSLILIGLAVYGVFVLRDPIRKSLDFVTALIEQELRQQNSTELQREEAVESPGAESSVR